MKWPFVWRSEYARVTSENYTLRDVLREANNELRRHRAVLAGIRSGQVDVVRVLDKIAKKAANR